MKHLTLIVISLCFFASSNANAVATHINGKPAAEAYKEFEKEWVKALTQAKREN